MKSKHQLKCAIESIVSSLCNFSLQFIQVCVFAFSPSPSVCMCMCVCVCVFSAMLAGHKNGTLPSKYIPFYPFTVHATVLSLFSLCTDEVASICRISYWGTLCRHKDTTVQPAFSVYMLIYIGKKQLTSI